MPRPPTSRRPSPRGSTPEESKKFRTAWEDWLRANKDKIDLAKLAEDAKLRNHTLVVLLDANRILDLDEKSQISGLWLLNVPPAPASLTD